MVNLVGGSAASGIFTKGGGDGIYDAKNDVGKFVQQNYQDGVDATIKLGFGYDVNDKLLDGKDPKSDLSQGVITNPFGALDKVYNKEDKKDDSKKTDDSKADNTKKDDSTSTTSNATKPTSSVGDSSVSTTESVSGGDGTGAKQSVEPQWDVAPTIPQK